MVAQCAMLGSCLLFDGLFHPAVREHPEIHGLMIEVWFETVPMRYFGQKPFVPLPVSARVPTMRLACNRLVINGLKIMFVFRDENETLNVQNFVPREARFWKPGQTR